MASLLIVRTPFQGWLAQKVIAQESIKVFDLIYFTQNDSEEDRHYYNELSLQARNSGYYYTKPKKPGILSSIIFKLKTRQWYIDKSYEKVLCASIDAYYVTSLVKKHSGAILITFDDGVANIDTTGIYFIEPTAKRAFFYKLLLNALSLKELKPFIQRHYTMYEGMENVVSLHRVVFLRKMFQRNSHKNTLSKEGTKTYFIGAPFEEEFTYKQIQRLTTVLNTFNIDFYIKHPRERKKINIKAPYLNKKGRIAEDAILIDAQNKDIILIGAFSTVMLNIGNLCAKRIVLLPKDSSTTEHLSKLSIDAGCELILI